MFQGFSKVFSRGVLQTKKSSPLWGGGGGRGKGRVLIQVLQYSSKSFFTVVLGILCLFFLVWSIKLMDILVSLYSNLHVSIVYEAVNPNRFFLPVV